MLERRLRVSFDASNIVVAHTYIAYTAFISALVFACLLHYKKVVKNDVAGYPEEWFPSVSATIGDWYPERNIFQILIALASGPRFALVCLQYYITRSKTSILPTIIFISGLLRTLSCGGWVYITSSDDHDAHDVLMITYILFNIPWMIGGIFCTPDNHKSARRKRVVSATGFFAAIVPLIYFFIQHKIHRIPGAYTTYSFFEWSLIFLDIIYDSSSELDFKQANIQITIGPPLPSDSEKYCLASINTQGANYSRRSKSSSSSEEPIPSMETATALSDTPATLEEVSQSPGARARWQYLRLKFSSQSRPIFSFLSDVYFSYIFWSVYTALIPTLFYFSIWELGIAGHELALLTTLSPILLSVKPVLSWASTRGGLTTLHLLSFLGLAAYLFNSPGVRLIVVACASIALNIRQAVDWGGLDACYQGVLTAAGLVLASLSKHTNHSNNPVWPMVDSQSGGFNKTGLLLAMLSLIEFYYRPASAIATGNKGPGSIAAQSPTAIWLFPSVALGGLIFSLHSLLMDSSTLIAWSWTGYENAQPKGPVPHLHGSLTLISQCAGILIPVALASSTIQSAHLLEHPLWFLYGTGSSFVMYRYKGWPGYIGGLNLAIFLMSIIPGVIQRAALTTKPARTYFMAWLISALLNLASVWTVAYAFVPGGSCLRERTDLVLAAQMITLSLGFKWPFLNRPTLRLTFSRSTASGIPALLALISITSVLATLFRLPSAPIRPFHPEPRILRAGIWTLHFGFDNQGRDSQRGARDLIRDMELDIVGFLETDLHRTVFGGRDLTRVAIETMGYYVDLGPGPNLHTWGAVLLSKFPIIKTTHHLLPSPHGELAPAIEAILDVYGTEITVVVAHNGQEEDPLDRELQSNELARIMASSYPRPVIFLGYVVTKPKAERPSPYEILISDGRVHDVDHDDWDRWCEYILYRGLYRTSYARISRGSITDTELQVAQFVVPRRTSRPTNDTEDARYLRCFKEDLAPDHWLPMDYYGEGKNGHFYHVFNTPLYYKIPEGVLL